MAAFSKEPPLKLVVEPLTTVVVPRFIVPPLLRFKLEVYIVMLEDDVNSTDAVKISISPVLAFILFLKIELPPLTVIFTPLCIVDTVFSNVFSPPSIIIFP
jgi:hypothetical protein